MRTMGGSQAAARRAFGPGSSAEWSTGGSSGTGTAPGTRRSSLDEATACVEEQRLAHTVQRRMHENNKKLAADEQRLVEEEARARRAPPPARTVYSAQAVRICDMKTPQNRRKSYCEEWGIGQDWAHRYLRHSTNTLE